MSGPNAFKVIAPGLLTSVQDLGRHGYQSVGLAENGAADSVAFRLGNWLLDNGENAAALEITLLGPVLQVLRTVAFCVAGADLGPTLNGRRVPNWTVLQAAPGDHLAFAGVVSGCRAYLCVAGGFDVPTVLGSRSTDLLARLGGLDGRQLMAGDLLPIGRPSRPIVSLIGRSVPPEFQPGLPAALTARVVLGPQTEHFTAAGIATLLDSEYVVGGGSTRMGVRLQGPLIEHSALGADILSDGTALGSLQVPGDGRPIVLLQGRQTMGGYAKLATVIASDVARLAQLRPGDSVRFAAVSVPEAHRIAWDTEAWLARAERALHALPAAALRPAAAPPPAAASPPPSPTVAARLKVRLLGREYEVFVEEET